MLAGRASGCFLDLGWWSFTKVRGLIRVRASIMEMLFSQGVAGGGNLKKVRGLVRGVGSKNKHHFLSSVLSVDKDSIAKEKNWTKFFFCQNFFQVQKKI